MTATASFKATKGEYEILDFTINYSELFATSDPTDQIQSSDWRVEGASGLVIDAMAIKLPEKAIVWVSGGGKLGEFHFLVNTVTTVGSRIYERTIEVEMRNK